MESTLMEERYYISAVRKRSHCCTALLSIATEGIHLLQNFAWFLRFLEGFPIFFLAVRSNSALSIKSRVELHVRFDFRRRKNLALNLNMYSTNHCQFGITSITSYLLSRQLFSLFSAASCWAEELRALAHGPDISPSGIHTRHSCFCGKKKKRRRSPL